MYKLKKITFLRLRQRQGREIDEFKGRITKLEADNQELKQMTTKVCLLISRNKKANLNIFFFIS